MLDGERLVISNMPMLWPASTAFWSKAASLFRRENDGNDVNMIRNPHNSLGTFIASTESG